MVYRVIPVFFASSSWVILPWSNLSLLIWLEIWNLSIPNPFPVEIQLGKPVEQPAEVERDKQDVEHDARGLPQDQQYECGDKNRADQDVGVSGRLERDQHVPR